MNSKFPFIPEKPRQIKATGTGNIAASLGSLQDPFVLHEIRLHLSGAGGGNNLTVTLNSANGSAYDTVLKTQDMTSITDLHIQFDSPVICFNGDAIDIAWTNGAGRTYGLEVVYSLY